LSFNLDDGTKINDDGKDLKILDSGHIPTDKALLESMLLAGRRNHIIKVNAHSDEIGKRMAQIAAVNGLRVDFGNQSHQSIYEQTSQAIEAAKVEESARVDPSKQDQKNEKPAPAKKSNKGKSRDTRGRGGFER